MRTSIVRSQNAWISWYEDSLLGRAGLADNPRRLTLCIGMPMHVERRRCDLYVRNAGWSYSDTEDMWMQFWTEALQLERFQPTLNEQLVIWRVRVDFIRRGVALYSTLVAACRSKLSWRQCGWWPPSRYLARRYQQQGYGSSVISTLFQLHVLVHGDNSVPLPAVSTSLGISHLRLKFYAQQVNYAAATRRTRRNSTMKAYWTGR